MLVSQHLLITCKDGELTISQDSPPLCWADLVVTNFIYIELKMNYLQLLPIASLPIFEEKIKCASSLKLGIGSSQLLHVPIIWHHIHTCSLPGPPPLEASSPSVLLLDIEFCPLQSSLLRVTSPPPCIPHSIPHAPHISKPTVIVLLLHLSTRPLLFHGFLRWYCLMGLLFPISLLRYFFLELLNAKPGLPYYMWSIDFWTFQCTTYLSVRFPQVIIS